ncbi:MAG: hypothetical protein JXA42_12215 [Anaerolineales bacterium]|nr:hypothetical protein [Anaerolineales bacterium]
MKRFWLLLRSEFTLFRTTIPIHLVGIFQPALMFSLIALTLVTPTFDVWVQRAATPLEDDLVDAMEQVGSPIGYPYIAPILVDEESASDSTVGQIITIENIDGVPTAIQYFGLIDSNMVKNFRNRLTNAALILWNRSLGDKAVTIEQIPLLPFDAPYNVYFGMAMLPLAAFIASSLIGAFQAAQEFEFKTIIEYRLSPVSIGLILGGRVIRLSLTGLISSLMLMVVVGATNKVWPASLGAAVLVFSAVAFFGGCLGTAAGLMIQIPLPSFVICLGASFFCWVVGSAYGLASGFGGAYEALSHFTPNSHAVELLFPLYFGITVGDSQQAVMMLFGFCSIMFAITLFTYWRKVKQAG